MSWSNLVKLVLYYLRYSCLWKVPVVNGKQICVVLMIWCNMDCKYALVVHCSEHIELVCPVLWIYLSVRGRKFDVLKRNFVGVMSSVAVKLSILHVDICESYAENLTSQIRSRKHWSTVWTAMSTIGIQNSFCWPVAKQFWNWINYQRFKEPIKRDYLMNVITIFREITSKKAFNRENLVIHFPVFVLKLLWQSCY